MMRRGWRTTLCFLLCICMIFSYATSVHAAAGGTALVAFGALSVISAVLVASGIVATEGGDFGSLCTDIYDGLSKASRIEPTVMLAVAGGISYIHTSIAALITGEAVKKSAYAPQKSSSYTVGGKSYRHVSSAVQLDKVFVLMGTISAIPEKEMWIPVSAPYGWSFKSYTPGKMILNLRTSFLATDSYNQLFASFEKCGVNYNYSYPLEVGDIIYRDAPMRGLYSTLRCSHGDVFTDYLSRAPVAGGEISVRFPWDITEDLPALSSAGTLDALNARWLALEREIAGTLSVPLSVPKDTVAGAGAQSQAQAQAGTNTLGFAKEDTADNAIDKVKDSAAKDFAEKGKLNISFVDFFPFCIPFDIIKGAKLLVAPAKDPVFNIPIKIPYLPQQVIRVDLVRFSGIAVFSRWFLTFAFVIGLAAGTSKVLKW